MHTNLSPLPKLTGEIILEVFTHRSLRFPGAPSNEDSEFGDNTRLAALGEKILEAAVTDTLFRKRPMLSAVDIEVCWRSYRILTTCLIAVDHADTTERTSIPPERRRLDHRIQAQG